MTDREKLIELLCEANSKSVDAELFEDSTYAQQLEIEADFLIANGVTVQRWIPVTERLPYIPEGWAENPDPVLYMMKSTGMIYAGYYGENGIYRDKYFRQYADGKEGVDAEDVRCWMWQHDLPEPPKEVE